MPFFSYFLYINYILFLKFYQFFLKKLDIALFSCYNKIRIEATFCFFGNVASKTKGGSKKLLIKLDYSLETPEERVRLVEQILAE